MPRKLIRNVRKYFSMKYAYSANFFDIILVVKFLCLIEQELLLYTMQDTLIFRCPKSCHISRSSVVQIVNRYEEFDTMENRSRSGRLRVANEREDRYLVQCP